MRFKRMCIIPAMVGTFFMLASTALANPDATSRVNCRLGDSHTWSNLGGDPVWSGGVSNAAQLSVVVRSASGQRSLVCLGLNQAERNVVTKQIAQAKSCTMKQGQKFIAMAFGSDGASVDRPTKFVDSRYKAGAPAFCLTVKVKEGKSWVTIKLLWPWKCVNAALISQATSKSPAKKPKVKPAPKLGPTVVCVLNGIKQYTQPPGYIINAQGQCVAQQQTQVVCSGDQITIRDSNGIAIACQAQEQQQTQNNNQTVTVIVSPVVTPPVVTITYNSSCSAVLTQNKNNREVFLNGNNSTASGGGVSVTTINWTFTLNGAFIGSATGIQATTTLPDYNITYGWSGVVRFSDGHTGSCSGSIQTGAAPPPLPGG